VGAGLEKREEEAARSKIMLPLEDPSISRWLPRFRLRHEAL
jgi:hypothetical protein